MFPHRTGTKPMHSQLWNEVLSHKVSTSPEVTVAGVLQWNVGKPAHCIKHGQMTQELGGNFVTTKDGPKDRGITVYYCPDCAKFARAARAKGV